MPGRRDARVDLDGDLRALRGPVRLEEVLREAVGLHGREVRRRPAAPVHLLDRAGGVDALGEEVDLPVEVREVGLDLRAVVALPVGLGDDLHEAAAEPALLVAEREVGVERDGRFPRVRAGAGLLVVLNADPLVPLGRGGVGGVAGALDVVLVEELRRHRERLAAKANRDGRHAAEVSTGATGSRWVRCIRRAGTAFIPRGLPSAPSGRERSTAGGAGPPARRCAGPRRPS